MENLGILFVIVFFYLHCYNLGSFLEISWLVNKVSFNNYHTYKYCKIFSQQFIYHFFLHMNSKPLKSEDAQNCSITRTIQAHENVPQAG